jgi:hypothetical protein
VGNAGFDANVIGLGFVIGFSFVFGLRFGIGFIVSKSFGLEVRRNSIFAVVLGGVFLGVDRIFAVEINVRASADL